MKLILLFFILFLEENIFAFDIQQWSKIIHYDNKPQIISQNFYLTNSVNVTPKLELEKTIFFLNSKKYGKKTACNYPLRYTFLKTQKVNIPNYNLQECKSLQNYVAKFQKDELYIVFSAEYIDVPSSAFGHIMLLFKDKKSPIEIADVVHFAAVATHDSFLKYNYKGLTGGYNGYYVHERFFKKLYEYNIKQQRNIYLYRLNYSKEDILKIIYHLYELRKATFKYYFLDNNCASLTTRLLEIPNKHIYNDEFFYMPIDTLHLFQKNIVNRSIYFSLITKIDYLYTRLSEKDKKKFDLIIQKNLHVSNNESNELKELVYYYYQFYFRKFHISYKNYNSILKLQYQKTTINSLSYNPINKKATTISIKQYIGKNDKKIRFSYRPLYQELNDFESNSLSKNEFSLFKIDLAIAKDNIDLNAFTLFSMKSYAYRTLYYKPISWNLSSAYNRENIQNKLKIQNKFGLGLSYKVFENIHISLLSDFGLENISLYVNPSLYIEKTFASFVKIEALSSINIFQNSKKIFYQNEIKTSFKEKNLVFMLNYIDNTITHGIELGVKYYF